MEDLKTKVARIVKEILAKKITSPTEKLKRKKYYDKHKKQIQDQAKKWRKENPAKVKNYLRRQKIKKLRTKKSPTLKKRKMF